MAETIKKPNTYWGSPESYAIKKTLDTLISCVNDLIENGGGGESGGGESGGGSVTPLNWELIDTVSNPTVGAELPYWYIFTETRKDNVNAKAIKIIGTSNVENTVLTTSTDFLSINTTGFSADEPTGGYLTQTEIGRTAIAGNRIEYYIYPDALLGVNVAEMTAIQETTASFDTATTVVTAVKQYVRCFSRNVNYGGLTINFNTSVEDSGSLLRQEGAMTFEIYAAY